MSSVLFDGCRLFQCNFNWWSSWRLCRVYAVGVIVVDTVVANDCCVGYVAGGCFVVFSFKCSSWLAFVLGVFDGAEFIDEVAGVGVESGVFFWSLFVCNLCSSCWWWCCWVYYWCKFYRWSIASCCVWCLVLGIGVVHLTNYKRCFELDSLSMLWHLMMDLHKTLIIILSLYYRTLIIILIFLSRM